MITFAELLKRAKSEKLAVHTPTEEQAVTLFKALDEKGYTWNSGAKLTIPRYESFREKTCYVFSRDCCGSKLNKEITYGSLKVHQEHDYTIIEFSDIDFAEKPTKTNGSIYYQSIWEAQYVAPSYLKELLKGAKEQHLSFIEFDDEDTLCIAYILANGDRFVIVQKTDKKKLNETHNSCIYQRKVN